MTREQAIEIIKQVCASVRVTLAEHQQIQKAIEILIANKDVKSK